MTRKFVRDCYVNTYSPAPNELVNGGFEIWQRETNWQRLLTTGKLVLQAAMTNTTGATTFTTKIGSSASVAGGAYNLPSAGWVRIKSTGGEEILHYTSYNVSSVVTVDVRGILQFQASESPQVHAINDPVQIVWATQGDYVADKWRLDTSPGSTNGRFAVWMGDTALDTGSNYSLGFRWAGGTLPAGAGFYGTPWASLPTGPARIYQNIEHYLGLVNKSLSFNARISCTTGKRIRLFVTALINQAGTTRTKILGYSGYNQGVAGFETLTLPNVVIPASAVPDIGGASGPIIGLQIGFEFAYGTSGAASDYNIEGHIDNAMLTVGPPTEYIQTDYTTDLMRCLRYYEKVYGGWSGYSQGTQYPGLFVPFRVPKSPNGVITRKTKGIWTMVNASGTTLPQVGDSVAITGYPVYPQFASGGIEQMGIWLFIKTNSAGVTTFQPSSADDFVEVAVIEQA